MNQAQWQRPYVNGLCEQIDLVWQKRFVSDLSEMVWYCFYLIVNLCENRDLDMIQNQTIQGSGALNMNLSAPLTYRLSENDPPTWSFVVAGPCAGEVGAGPVLESLRQFGVDYHCRLNWYDLTMEGGSATWTAKKGNSK